MSPMRPLSREWYPSPPKATALSKEFGHLIDLGLSLRRFRNHYTDGQTSRDWDAKFENWVLADAERARQHQEGGTDELGFPLTRRGMGAAPLRPGDPGYVSIDDLATAARLNRGATA